VSLVTRCRRQRRFGDLAPRRISSRLIDRLVDPGDNGLRYVLITGTLVLIMSTEVNPLTDVLFGQTRGGVLGLLYGQTDKTFYVRQIARHLDSSVGAVQRELEKLAKVGLIVRTSVGNQVFYQANQGSPIFAEMRTLLAKTVGVFELLRGALDPLSKDISVALVYGSVARQEETYASDVDLMIVGRVSLDHVLSLMPAVETSLGRQVNATVYSRDEFRSKLATGNHFLTSVVQGKKVFLIGDEDELRKVGGIRLAETGAKQSKRD
jgi:predicted nucleotidyltransferase